MKDYLFTFAAAILLAFTVASCDEGRIEEQSKSNDSGRTVNITAQLTGVDSWPESSYYVALAGFNDTSNYAVILKQVAAPSEEGGTVSMSLSNISDEVTHVELCVVTRLRQHVMALYTIDEDELKASDEITVNVGSLNVGMFNTIQQNVFNTTCANCHGASTHAAAGLYLTEGRSYAAIVNQSSTKVEGGKIVEPYNSNGSVLYRTLSSSLSSEGGWGYNHASEVTDSNVLGIIRSWIDNGAEE